MMAYQKKSEMEIRAEARFLRGYYHFEAKKNLEHGPLY